MIQEGEMLPNVELQTNTRQKCRKRFHPRLLWGKKVCSLLCQELLLRLVLPSTCQAMWSKHKPFVPRGLSKLLAFQSMILSLWRRGEKNTKRQVRRLICWLMAVRFLPRRQAWS